MLKKFRKKVKNQIIALLAICAVGAGFSGGGWDGGLQAVNTPRAADLVIGQEQIAESVDVLSIPAYSGEPYVALNGNVPEFTDEELANAQVSFEEYSELDSLGRCGVAYASVGLDLMPTEERGSISEVKPSGWKNKQYGCVDGGWLYNRCHLIGYQLTAENANEENLITGTRYFNVEGMLPFENMVADYVKETGCHVLYRVTPIYTGDNLVADGVQMEAQSVEDGGEEVLYNVFVYNVQPGIGIDYATGDSWEDGNVVYSSIAGAAAGSAATGSIGDVSGTGGSGSISSGQYVLNTNTKKFHLPTCSSVSSMSEKNKEVYSGSRADLIAQGYEACKRCNP